MQIGPAMLENSWLLLVNSHLLWDPVIPLLSTYQGEIEAYVHTKTCVLWKYSIFIHSR